MSISIPLHHFRSLMCIAALLCLSAVSARAQTLLAKRVTIDANKKPMSDVLKAMGRQGGFYFSYNSNIVRGDSLITVHAKGMTVKQVLDQLLGTDFKYVETDKYIILQPPEREKWYTISGYVTDGTTGEVLPDVTIFERQQLASAITGKDGFFKLQLKDRERYKSAELVVKKGFYVDTSVSLIKGYDQELSLSIVPETYALPDMVVTQYSGVGRSKLAQFLLSSKLKTQNLNLGKFFVDKPYQVSLIPGLGTHGNMSGNVANKVSFNVLGGYTGGVDGVECAGVFNINKKDAKYVQMAGVCNIVAGNAEGVQASGVSNYVEGYARGVQMAGVMNKAGRVDGMQASGMVNVAFDTVSGVQLGGFINGAPAANVQAAGFINVAGVVDGMQLAGFVNLARSVRGNQSAGFINLAENVDGVQVAGFINIARKVKGAQIAAFINIADSSDCPIGFINIVRSGDKAIGVTVDEFGITSIALRSGGRILYGIFGFASDLNTVNMKNGFELGFGAHLKITRHFRINSELASLAITDFSGSYYNDYALRVLPAVRMGPIEVFAGAGLNTSYYSQLPVALAGINTTPLFTEHITGEHAGMRLGYKAGLQVHF
ncbi:MAG: hypothetical protein KF744_10535 [Taibaiella sp.]|nr:hypothetical protein [Taibaiella sp.]